MPSQIRSHIIYPSYFSWPAPLVRLQDAWAFFLTWLLSLTTIVLLPRETSSSQCPISDHIHVHMYNIYYSKIIATISCQQFVVFSFFFLHRYNISWTVDSHTPVEEFKLFFRRLPQGHEIENSIEHPQQPLQHHNGQAHRYANVIMHWSRNDWRDVVLPAVPLSHHYTQSMSYMIRGLDPDQQYEARVQARYVFIFVICEVIHGAVCCAMHIIWSSLSLCIFTIFFFLYLFFFFL